MHQNQKHSWTQRLKRAFRYQFIRLFRSPEGAKKVARGFAIGFGLEMIVLCTASLIYLIFYPIVRLSRASLPAAIIGNIIGKLTFLPILLLPFAKIIGSWISPIQPSGSGIQEYSLSEITEIFTGNFQILYNILHSGLHILIGMSIFGLILGVASYFVIYYLYEKQQKNRLKKRSSKQSTSLC
ncbi:Uncharacterized conserved protein, DUF2062 family [Marininema mesophilum]|uniref:Uncharacterized conserved protein, DUF2062 family n=1 Tax=Marininema mesophilum TaxID=1048340 RepID=A0A1H2ZZ22_9BACL|nr:DUF2062 domain-containing protein [Marininema mesophilum]SDX22697.1 Uncharacterized conserved protein, DUF2062 family [Marininema mesophilum]